MSTIIRNKDTGEILHTYEGAPLDQSVWINNFDHSWADPAVVEHVEIPDRPGEQGDYDLDATSDPPVWVPNLSAMRARLLGKFERDGFSRVAAVHPPHHLSRLGLLPPGNSEAQAALVLVEGVRQAVNDAEDAIDLITDVEELEAFEPTWPE